MDENRYTQAEDPWEWICRDCHPNARIVDREIHDYWHKKWQEARLAVAR